MVTIADRAVPFDEQWRDFIAYLDGYRQENPRAAMVALARDFRWRVSYWVLRQVNLWGVEEMARGKSKATTSAKPGTKQWTTFVEISLAGHDMASIEQMFPDAGAVFDAVAQMLSEGYRVSLSYNPANDAVIASVTCKNEDSVNAGCTYTSFASDWLTALRIAAYKHFVVTEEDWGGVAGANSRPAFG